MPSGCEPYSFFIECCKMFITPSITTTYVQLGVIDFSFFIRCIWRKPRESGSPWCVFPEDKKKGYGYVLVGNVNSTNNGFAAFLERVKTPSVHGNEIERLRVTAEFQTDARMRIKVATQVQCSVYRYIFFFRNQYCQCCIVDHLKASRFYQLYYCSCRDTI